MVGFGSPIPWVLLASLGTSMALEQKLSLKLSQRLVMTPSLQQAIKLLQMTRLELEGVLSQELEENPILEEPEGDPAERELEAQETEQEPESDEAEDPMDDIDLDAYFNEYLEAQTERGGGTYEPGEAVPIEATVAEEEDLYDHLVWQLHMMELPANLLEVAELVVGNLDQDGFLAATIEEIQLLGADTEERARFEKQQAARTPTEEATPASAEGADTPVPQKQVVPIFAAAADPDDVSAQLEAAHGQANASASDPEGEATTEAATEGESDQASSSPSARDFPATDELETPGYSREQVEEAIALVQTLDPHGVGCRNLRESLLLQLRLKGEEDTISYQLVDEFWDMCLKRQFPAIAKRIGVPLQTLKEPAERIAQLETRPGRQYGGERTHYVEPDVHIVRVGDRFVVQVNDDGLPRLRVSGAYKKMLRDLKGEGRDSEAQQYIREKMRSAMWLIKSLDQRQRTIYKVAESIVKQQQEFFERGIEYLRPMVLRDVADDIEMHESTVSRVVSNKYMHTPRGLYPMKFFFHSGIDRDMGEDISSLTVKRKIKHLIEAEDDKKPLSDSALTRKLKAEGIQIARRTVAKYRDELGIPSSTDRKRVF